MRAEESLPEAGDRDGGLVEELIASLHGRFHDRVRVFAARRLGDAAAAEDVAQETLRRVVEALRARRVDDLAALPAFVFQTARNICMHHGRARRRRDAALVRFGTDTIASDDPLADLVSDERARAVREELARMDPADRDLLEMIYVAELDTAEIARRFGVTPGALRVRKHRALERLARRFGAIGNESDPAGTRRGEW
ncbi:MAG: RNA polymerase sigma factor [Thermoanaerobaculia bacterium]